MLTRETIITASTRLNLAVKEGVLSEEATNPFSNSEKQRQAVQEYLRQLMTRGELKGDVTESDLKPLVAHLVGMGPLDALTADPSVVSINVRDYDHVMVTRGGVWDKANVAWESPEAFANFAYGLASRTGTALDRNNHPVVEANFKPAGRIQIDSRARNASKVTLHVRIGRVHPITLHQMASAGNLSGAMFNFMVEVAQRDMGVLIVGKPAAGKTTLLEAWMDLWPLVPVVGLDDRSEFYPRHPLCSLYDVPSTQLRLALAESLRKNVSRIAVAEVRGDESAEMLRYSAAMTMWTTLHSTADHAVLRLSGLVKGAKDSPYANVPELTLRQTIAAAFPIVVESEMMVVGGRPQFYVAQIAHLDEKDAHLETLFRARLDGPHLLGFETGEGDVAQILQKYRRRIWGSVQVPNLNMLDTLAEKSPALALAALGEYLAVRPGDTRAISLLSSFVSRIQAIRELVDTRTDEYEAQIRDAAARRDWGQLLEIMSSLKSDPVIYEMSYGKLMALVGNLPMDEMARRANVVASATEIMALAGVAGAGVAGASDTRHIMALVGLLNTVKQERDTFPPAFGPDVLKHLRQIKLAGRAPNTPAHLRLLEAEGD